MADKINDAAQTIMNAEIGALTALQTALTTLTTSVDAAVSGLSYPANFRSDAQRISQEIKSNLSWKLTEVSQLLNTLNGTTSTPTGTMATPTTAA